MGERGKRVKKVSEEKKPILKAGCIKNKIALQKKAVTVQTASTNSLVQNTNEREVRV